jgi:hypothetical protein
MVYRIQIVGKVNLEATIIETMALHPETKYKLVSKTKSAKVTDESLSLFFWRVSIRLIIAVFAVRKSIRNRYTLRY